MDRVMNCLEWTGKDQGSYFFNNRHEERRDVGSKRRRRRKMRDMLLADAKHKEGDGRWR